MKSIKSRAKRQHEAMLEQQNASAVQSPPVVPPAPAQTPPENDSKKNNNDQSSPAVALPNVTSEHIQKGPDASDASRKKAKTSKARPKSTPTKSKEVNSKDKELKALKRNSVKQNLQKLRQERLGFAALTVEQVHGRLGLNSFSDIKVLSRSEVLQVLLTMKRENYAENPAFKALFAVEDFQKRYGDKPKLKTSKGKDSLEQLKMRLGHYLLLKPTF